MVALSAVQAIEMQFAESQLSNNLIEVDATEVNALETLLAETPVVRVTDISEDNPLCAALPGCCDKTDGQNLAACKKWEEDLERDIESCYELLTDGLPDEWRQLECEEEIQAELDAGCPDHIINSGTETGKSQACTDWEQNVESQLKECDNK